MVRAVLARRAAASALADLFEARFRPGLVDRPEAVRRAEEALARELEAVEDDLARRVLTAMRDFVLLALRTNAYLPTRLGLSFRMDPDFLPEPIRITSYNVCYTKLLRSRPPAKASRTLSPGRRGKTQAAVAACLLRAKKSFSQYGGRYPSALTNGTTQD